MVRYKNEHNITDFVEESGVEHHEAYMGGIANILAAPTPSPKRPRAVTDRRRFLGHTTSSDSERGHSVEREIEFGNPIWAEPRKTSSTSKEQSPAGYSLFVSKDGSMSPTARNDAVHETRKPERLPGVRQHVHMYALGFPLTRLTLCRVVGSRWRLSKSIFKHTRRWSSSHDGLHQLWSNRRVHRRVG